MEEKVKYKFLVEMSKGMDEMIENDNLLLTQKKVLMERFEEILFEKEA